MKRIYKIAAMALSFMLLFGQMNVYAEIASAARDAETEAVAAEEIEAEAEEAEDALEAAVLNLIEELKFELVTPVPGEKPVDAVVPEGEQYEIVPQKDSGWKEPMTGGLMSSEDVFAPGQNYTLTVYLQAKEGWKFAKDASSIKKNFDRENNPDVYTVASYESSEGIYKFRIQFRTTSGSSGSQGQKKTYNIKVNGGTSSPAGKAKASTRVSLKADKKEGYEFESWEIVSGISETEVELSKETAGFNMPENDVEITAKFRQSQSAEPQEKVISNMEFTLTEPVEGAKPVEDFATLTEGIRIVESDSQWQTKDA